MLEDCYFFEDISSLNVGRDRTLSQVFSKKRACWKARRLVSILFISFTYRSTSVLVYCKPNRLS